MRRNACRRRPCNSGEVERFYCGLVQHRSAGVCAAPFRKRKEPLNKIVDGLKLFIRPRKDVLQHAAFIITPAAVELENRCSTHKHFDAYRRRMPRAITGGERETQLAAPVWFRFLSKCATAH